MIRRSPPPADPPSRPGAPSGSSRQADDLGQADGPAQAGDPADPRERAHRKPDDHELARMITDAEGRAGQAEDA